jgi:hypothetical protein
MTPQERFESYEVVSKYPDWEGITREQIRKMLIDGYGVDEEKVDALIISMVGWVVDNPGGLK